MGKFLIPLIILAGITVLIIAVFVRQWSENTENKDQDGLEEWTCPECGFSVQLGTECPYCYTRKSE
ncbi:MAG: hypothetical protein V3U16_07450 [Candidatus Neomarinimicrobiota bacterium]